MKVFAVLLLAVAAANAASVVPVESSVVKNERVGGNFAYSVQESKGAYVAPDAVPIVAARVATPAVVAPVAPVMKYAAAPAVTTYTAPAVMPVEVKSNVEYKPVFYAAPEYKPVEYKSVEYKPAVMPYYSAEVKSAVVQPTVYAAGYYNPTVVSFPSEVKTAEVKTAEVKSMYDKPVMGYYGYPTATYSAYPYMTYPQTYYPAAAQTYMPYNFPYVVKAEK